MTGAARYEVFAHSSLAKQRDARAGIRRSGSWKYLIGFLFCYGACLFILLPQLSLWLDEILDLKGVRGNGLQSLLAYVARSGGGVPLGYLAQGVAIHTLGYSMFSGRLPAAVSSLASCVGLFLLGRRANLRRPLLAVAIFCAVPLDLRYALEARPYSQALALTVWATVFFFKLVDEPRFGPSIAYTLTVLAGLYTQPYALFVPCAHFLWLCVSRTQRNRKLLLLVTSGAIAVSGLLYLPWFLYAHRFWNAPATVHYTIGAHAVLLILREITGAGYLGTALLLFPVWIAFKKGITGSNSRLFWAIYITLPTALAVIGDISFNYFLAIRQMIFILPVLALLAACGIETLSGYRRSWATITACALLAVFVGNDVWFFIRPRENWQAASKTLETLAKNGSCVMFVPGSSAAIYRFFDSTLPGHMCQKDLSDIVSVAVAVSPYGDPQQGADTLSTLQRKGLLRLSELNPQGPRIYLLSRRRNP